MRLSAILLTPFLLGGVALSMLDKPAFSQDALPRVGELAPASRIIELSPDDMVLAERYVGAEADLPVVEDHMTLRPGSVIPAGVPLRVFSNVSELRRFAYFVSVDNKIVIADPQSRVVVRIIDKKA